MILIITIILLFMHIIDYSSSASVQQSQSPPAVQAQVDVHPQSPKNVSNEQQAPWLRNHPILSGPDYEEDISKLILGTQQDIANYTCACSSTSRS
jgi:hypothetical protein